MNFFVLLVTSVALNVSANVFLKKGVTAFGGISGKGNSIAADLLKAATSPYIILGQAFYGLSFLLWLRVLSFNDLSKAYPIFASFVFLFTTIASFFILKENISALRIVGILVILFGIIVVAKS